MCFHCFLSVFFVVGVFFLGVFFCFYCFLLVIDEKNRGVLKKSIFFVFVCSRFFIFVLKKISNGNTQTKSLPGCSQQNT